MATQFFIRNAVLERPDSLDRVLDFRGQSSGSNLVTVILGRNGTGKSSLLREIAMSFRSYFASQKLKNRQGLGRVQSINFCTDGEEHRLNVLSDSKDFSEEREQLRSASVGPSKLIALSFTPFDKFPPADDVRFGDMPTSVTPFYVYLGFKADFRMAPKGRLLDSVHGLAFPLSVSNLDPRVVGALSALGYRPWLTITYGLRVSSNRYRSNSEYDHVRELLRHVPKGKTKEMQYLVNFESGARESQVSIGPYEIRDYVQKGILSPRSVTLQKEDGSEVDLLELSSGELNLLSGFLGLVEHLEDGSLVLIDEPENSLHPEWQLKYIEMLGAILQQYKGCHYIIATHSPLIVSGLSGEGSAILILDGAPKTLSTETFVGASPDATLINAFSVVTEGNSFLKQIVLEAFTLIEAGNRRSPRSRQIANFLAGLEERIPESDPLKKLVPQVIKAIVAD